MIRSLGRVLANSVFLPILPKSGIPVCQIRKMSRILRFDGLPYRMGSEDFQDWIYDLSEINPEKVINIKITFLICSGFFYVAQLDHNLFYS